MPDRLTIVITFCPTCQECTPHIKRLDGQYSCLGCFANERVTLKSPGQVEGGLGTSLDYGFISARKLKRLENSFLSPARYHPKGTDPDGFRPYSPQ